MRACSSGRAASKAPASLRALIYNALIKPPGGGIKRKHPHFLGKLGEQGEVMLGEESRVREEDKPYKKVTRGARKDASGRRQEARNMKQGTRGERQEARDKRQEPRGKGQTASGKI